MKGLRVEPGERRLRVPSTWPEMLSLKKSAEPACASRGRIRAGPRGRWGIRAVALAAATGAVDARWRYATLSACGWAGSSGYRRDLPHQPPAISFAASYSPDANPFAESKCL